MNRSRLPVEQMASAHVAQIPLQPSGPYLLAGWSFGGVLAFEIARQLAAGEGAHRFPRPARCQSAARSDHRLPTAATPHFALLTQALRELERRASGLDAPVEFSRVFADPTWRDLLGGGIPDRLSAAHLKKNLVVARNSMRAAMDYRPQPYGGAIDLFQAAASPCGIQGRLADDLRSLARGALRIHQVQGDHCGILRAPHVAATARALDFALDSLGRE